MYADTRPTLTDHESTAEYCVAAPAPHTSFSSCGPRGRLGGYPCSSPTACMHAENSRASRLCYITSSYLICQSRACTASIEPPSSATISILCWHLLKLNCLQVCWRILSLTVDTSCMCMLVVSAIYLTKLPHSSKQTPLAAIRYPPKINAGMYIKRARPHCTTGHLVKAW